MPETEADRAFEAMAHAVEIVRHEFRQMRPAIGKRAGEDGSTRKGCVHGLLLRVGSWLESLRRLDSSVHVQAIFAGARSAIECLVDMMLVGQDATDGAARKMHAWERSAKLEHVKRVEKHFQAQSGKRIITGRAMGFSKWIAEHEDEIKKDRKRFWGSEEHPNWMRWTGKDRRLWDDLRQAEEQALAAGPPRGDANPLGVYPLQKNRALCGTPLNWATHGSTLALLRGKDKKAITRMAATGLMLAAEMALQCLGITLRVCDLQDESKHLEDVARRVRGMAHEYIRKGEIQIAV